MRMHYVHVSRIWEPVKGRKAGGQPVPNNGPEMIVQAAAGTGTD